MGDPLVLDFRSTMKTMGTTWCLDVFGSLQGSLVFGVLLPEIFTRSTSSEGQSHPANSPRAAEKRNDRSEFASVEGTRNIISERVQLAWNIVPWVYPNTCNSG